MSFEDTCENREAVLVGGDPELLQWGENETSYDGADIPYSKNAVVLYLGLVLNALAYLGCLLSIVFICVFRKHRVLRMAQPFFLGWICIGSSTIAVCGILTEIYDISLTTNKVLVYSNSDGNQQCMESIRAFFYGLIVVYMSLFLKTWRIQKVTRLRRNQNVQIHHVLWPSLLMELLFAATITTWGFWNPPYWRPYIFVRNIIDGDGEEVLLVGSFRICEYFCNQPFYYILLGLMYASFILGYWMSRKIPNSVPEELHDGKEVRLLYLIHTAIWTVGSISNGIGEGLRVHFLTTLESVYFTFPMAIAPIAVLIAPKVYAVWYERKHGGNFAGRIGTGNVVVRGIDTTAAPATTDTNGDSNSSDPV